jgi:carbon storage regulator
MIAMLVLSRKTGEAIVLAGTVTVYVLGIEHDRVKIGVDAPPDVLVLRSELVHQERGADDDPDGEPRAGNPRPAR